MSDGARVHEVSSRYENVLVRPRTGPGVCITCFNFTEGYERCYACTHAEPWLDAMAPISYSPGGEPLHRALASYKRAAGEVAQCAAAELSAILWRFLENHEPCLARAAGVARFSIATTVPSSARRRDGDHPLEHIVGRLVGPTRDRHRRLLRRSSAPADGRAFSRERFVAIRQLGGESVLLMDDTWTTGASAQSAAAALKHAGARAVAAVVIGRYVNRHWHENDRRLGELGCPFDWARCVLCAERTESSLTCEPWVAA